MINITRHNLQRYDMQNHNILLANIQMPGETFRLPSGGLFYSPELNIINPSITDGELHVHPMTAIDEIVFKTPDLLYSGQAIKQVFARCIPDILDWSQLLAKDVDFLLICLRKVSYGSDMELQYTHTCESAKEHSYTISVDEFIRKSKRIDPSRISNDFTVTLNNKQVIKLAPLTFGNYIELMQTSNTKDEIPPDKLANMLCLTISKMILSVDNISDKTLIIEWLLNIPPILRKQLTDAIEKITEWGPDFKTTLQCKDCGMEEAIQAPLNPLSFFT